MAPEQLCTLLSGESADLSTLQSRVEAEDMFKGNCLICLDEFSEDYPIAGPFIYNSRELVLLEVYSIPESIFYSQSYASVSSYSVRQNVAPVIQFSRCLPPLKLPEF